jgi:hypothetical protein
VDRLAYRLLGMRYLIGPRLEEHHIAPSTQAAWQPIPSPEPSVALYRNDQAMPRAWVAPRAMWFDTADEVIEKLVTSDEDAAAPLDFDPRQVVLVDRQVDADAAEQMAQERGLFDVQGTTRPASPPVITFDPKNTPERVHLTITNPTDGWLVLADAYMNGWVATVSDGATAQPVRRAILPAYGVLRAVPIRASGRAGRVDHIDVTFEYKPAAWRYGLMATAGGAVVLLLLLGFGMMGARKLEDRP